jgi:hypothetical protein
MKKLIMAIAIVFVANAAQAQSSAYFGQGMTGTSTIARCAPWYIVKCDPAAGAEAKVYIAAGTALGDGSDSNHPQVESQRFFQKMRLRDS